MHGMSGDACVCRGMPCFAAAVQESYNPGPRVATAAEEGGPAMGKVLPGPTPPEKQPEDRLDSWKEIAAYLNRDVTTVQRWEKREGMPVQRHLHDQKGSVYASRAELDAWVSSRNLRGAQQNGNGVAPGDILLPPAPGQSPQQYSDDAQAPGDQAGPAPASKFRIPKPGWLLLVAGL